MTSSAHHKIVRIATNPQAKTLSAAQKQLLREWQDTVPTAAIADAPFHKL